MYEYRHMTTRRKQKPFQAVELLSNAAISLTNTVSLWIEIEQLKPPGYNFTDIDKLIAAMCKANFVLHQSVIAAVTDISFCCDFVT